jgi:uncharacterized RDD family membrane protein YckC
MQRKSKTTTFLLCYFLGTLGVHRFYLNRVVTGLLMLITGGGLGIWWLIDCFLVVSDRLADSKGQAPEAFAPDPDEPRAGFWVRAAAMCADNLLIGLALMVIGVASALVIPGIAGTPGGETTAALVAAAAGLLVVVGVLLYYAVPLASEQRATWGKRAFGICVVTRDGETLGLGRALWRTLCYLLSALPFYLGFLLAGLGKQKRALHDILAGTQVLYASATAASLRAPRSESKPAAAEPVTTPAAATAAVAAEPSVRRSTGAPMGLVLLGLLLLGAAAFLALA